MRSIIVFAIGATAVAPPALAAPGDMLIKARASVSETMSSRPVAVTVGDQVAEIKPHRAVGGEVSLAYFVTDRVALEAGFGLRHYELRDGLARTFVNAGMVVPTVSLQYHLMPGGRLRPYIGAGGAYSGFYSVELAEGFTDRQNPPSEPYQADIRGSFQPMAQAGLDYDLNAKLYLNVEAKFIAGKTRFTLLQSGSRQSASLRSDTVSVAVGVGTRF